ncbi:MAG: hypothetical protein JNL67_21795 [Planctomycetaceae bacterium]|nr:hypothetical protein [Planctomycetaceae bacterium]
MNATLPTSTDSEYQTALIIVGATGVWGRFKVPWQIAASIDDWVVCQTGRGLEMGRVKLFLTDDADTESEWVGPVLRIATDADLLTRQRIERAVPQGIDACNLWLGENGFAQIVLDVDVPLDGQRLYFHFLGDVDRSLESATEKLVELFDKSTGIRSFTEAVAVGCGPNCGSDGTGCQTGTAQSGAPAAEGTAASTSRKHGCGSCALSGGCGKRS